MAQFVFRRTGQYRIAFASHSGLAFTVASAVERDEVPSILRARLKRARRLGFIVSRIDKTSWEIVGNDDSCGVSDIEGILTVQPERARFRRILGRLIPC